MSAESKIISHISPDHRKASIIFEFSGEFWSMSTDNDQLLDVLNMPGYIAEDWLCANRAEIDDATIDGHIIEASKDLDLKKKYLKNAEKKLADLQAIKRNIIIDRIL